jgi:molybdenum cofactor cytidylyltransferase
MPSAARPAGRRGSRVRPDPFVSGLVLAAGGSSRLGRPKQLLPYRGATLLDAVLDTARSCEFDQLVVTLGGSVRQVREAVDLSGADVVVNETFGSGCSSSIAAALRAVDAACDVLVLLLGDQPGVSTESVRRLIAGRGDAPIALCAYSDGRGHPFAFGRKMFGELRSLRGDKAVWKLLEGRARDVVDVPVAGPVPRDVDTWKDYDAVVAAAGQ